MKTSCLICWIVTVVVLLSHPGWTEQSHGGHVKKENMMEWGGISNRVRGIKQRDVYPFNLWELYKNSSTFQKPKVVKEIQDAVTKLAYLDSRIDILGLILFGPKNRQSIIRAVRDEKRQMVDDQKCLKSTLKLFEKHCGLLTDHDMKQSLANICNYIVEKAAIKEAIILACGMRDTEPHAIGIDVADPKIDVTPAPVRGRFEYCGRVVVNGVLRRQLGSYAKAYQIMVVPSKKQIHDRWHNMIQICFHQMELRSYAKSYKVMFEPLVFHEMHNKTQVCFHRNASRGLCQCKKDDWKFIRRGSREFLLSPYEHKFVDVKFNSGVYGFVTVTIKEDLLERWRCVFLVLGVVALFVDGSKDILNQNAADGVDRVLDWAMRVAAVIAIFLSSFDTLLAVAVLASFFALNFVIIPIIAPILKTKSSRWVKLRESSTKDSVAERENFTDTRFRDWVIKNLDRIVVLSDNSQDDHCT